jgi:hypothetical protein
VTLSAEDRQQILDLYARYAHSIDGGDAEACASCFASDGVLRVGERRGQVGRGEIAAFASRWRASLDAVPRHVSWHVLLSADGADVRGVASAGLLTTDADGAVSIVFTATYRDHFVWVSGEWFIRERAVLIDRVGSR